MTNRNSFFIILTILFFINHPLWAQKAQSGGNYVIEQRYVQQLVWVGDEYAFKYEVVIERGEGRTYRAYQREFTEKPTLQISLPPGNYRYRVISYDYLEQPGDASVWINLEIKPSPIVSVEVETDENGSYIIRSPGSDQIVPGVNEIIIKNPDELEIENGKLIVDEQTAGGSQKTFSFYLSAAWSPLIPLYGGIQEIFGNEFYAAGASMCFGAFYNKLNWWFSPGLEFSSSWYALNKTQGGDTVGIQAGATGFNIIAQKRFFSQKMAVTLRAGGALAFQIGETTIGQESYAIGGLAPQLNLGASFLYQVWKQLYLETGVSFTFHMNQNNSSGYLRPWFGIGWKF
jgi:hypothetical protein